MSFLSFSSLAIHLLTKLNKETEKLKKNVSSTRKIKTKKVKAVKSRIKKKEKEIKKLRKVNKATAECSLDSTTRELYSSYQDLEELENKYFEDLNETEEQYLTLTLKTLESVFKEESKLYRNNECLAKILGIMTQVSQGNQREENHKMEEREEEKSGVQVMPESHEEEDNDEPSPLVEDVIERPQSVMETSMMGSRAGSFLSLSSVASFSYRDDGQVQPQQQMFSTIKRCHSPFTKTAPASNQPRRRDSRRRLDGSRPPLPPLPPVQPQPRPPRIQSEDSLGHLRQKMEEISSIRKPSFVPRSPYIEDNSTGELHQRLKFLSLTTTKDPYVDKGRKTIKYIFNSYPNDSILSCRSNG